MAAAIFSSQTNANYFQHLAPLANPALTICQNFFHHRPAIFLLIIIFKIALSTLGTGQKPMMKLWRQSSARHNTAPLRTKQTSLRPWRYPFGRFFLLIKLSIPTAALLIKIFQNRGCYIIRNIGNEFVRKMLNIIFVIWRSEGC